MLNMTVVRATVEAFSVVTLHCCFLNSLPSSTTAVDRTGKPRILECHNPSSLANTVECPHAQSVLWETHGSHPGRLVGGVAVV